jgi:hypothetical protein
MTIIIHFVFCYLLPIYLILLHQATKNTSVILLFLLGWIVREATLLFDIDLPDLTDVSNFRNYWAYSYCTRRVARIRFNKLAY